MKTLFEIKALDYLKEISELIDQTDTGDKEYTELREEKERLETALVNPLIDLKEAMSKRQMSYGIKGKALGIVRAPRVTKVYFDVANDIQAKGFGMRNDKGSWYMNVWGDNLSVTDLNQYVQGKGIPFPVVKYNVYGGRHI